MEISSMSTQRKGCLRKNRLAEEDLPARMIRMQMINSCRERRLKIERAKVTGVTRVGAEALRVKEILESWLFLRSMGVFE